MGYFDKKDKRSSDLVERIKRFALDSKNLKLVKGLGFTITEAGDGLALEAWLDARLAGNDAKADDIVFAGIMLEHFQSLLSERTDEITEEEKAIAAQLERFFDEALNEPDEDVNPVMRENDDNDVR